MRQEEAPQNQTERDALPSALPAEHGVVPPRKTSRTVWVPRALKSDNLDDFFLGNRDDLQRFFDVEQVILYAVNREKRELFSKILRDPLDGLQDIRVPITEHTLSGYCAKYGKLLNIADANDAAELARLSPHLCCDLVWKEGCGVQPRQILAAPIVYNRKYLLGVLLLINRRSGELVYRRRGRGCP